MDFALIIGVGKFKNNLGNLSFVENDVNSFIKVLRDVFQISEECMKVLINEEASYSKIRENVETIVQSDGVNNRVFIYFASHGKSVYETPYLACYDSENKDCNTINNWLCVPKIIGIFCEKKFNTLVFLDCCQSTFTFSSRGILHSDTPVNQKSIPYYGDYVGVFAAAGAKEKAYSDCQAEHGCWTHYLIKALRGDEPQAFKENTRQITHLSLQEYLKTQVSRRVKELYNQNQTPHFWGAYSSEIIINVYSKLEDSNLKVRDIYFGEIDADSEREKAPMAEYFTKNFFDLNSISDVLLPSDNTLMILGNKGTGKTYIGEYFETAHKNVIYQNIKAVTIKAISNITPAQMNEKGKYTISWEYIALTIFSIISVKRSLKGASKFKEILEDIYGQKANQLFSANTLRMAVICDKQILNSIKLNDAYKTYTDRNGKCTISDVIALYEDIINNLYMNDNQFVFLDGLDEQIRDSLSERLRNILLDLFDAIVNLQEVLTKVKFILLIRHDIFTMLTGQANLNKIRKARSKELTWVDTNSVVKNTPLYQFIEKRVITSMVTHSKYTTDFSLKNILPSNMQKQNTWDWILELTTYKPRDVVAFFNECKSMASKEQTIFTPQNLWDATRTYADYLWDEFCDNLGGTEWASYTDDIFKLLSILGEAHTIQTGVRFNYTDFISALGQVQCFKDRVPNKLLAQLYEVGILRVHTKHGSYWKFREQPIEFNSNAWKDYFFEIHKGLWKKIHIW